MLVRTAAMRDLESLASLVESYWTFESIDGFDRARVQSLLRKLLSEPERGACWVAEADGEVRGYLLAVFVFSLEHGGLMAEIDELFVAPKARSAGVGSLLVSVAERSLAERGVLRLQLQLGAANGGARRFYERHGFSRAGYDLLGKVLQAEE
jgi:GNAT superfamily N-acetyltransferase